MITKPQIQALLKSNLTEIYRLINDKQDTKTLLFLMENLGQLPENFDGRVFIPLLKHNYNQIRFWAIKNLGKLQDVTQLQLFMQIAQNDSDSMVRREAVSSIGRIRDRSAIPFLLQTLHDEDPKIVLQAVRGLLVFKYNPLVVEALKKLSTHPNETIQDVIAKEFPEEQTEQNAKSSIPHPVSPDFMRNVVVCGDVLQVLQIVPDEAIHLTFTSPPYYNARDYSIYASYQEYLDFLTEVFSGVHRITKEGRFIIVNTSPVIVPRVSRAHSSRRYAIPFDLHARMVQIGWEFIDDIVWAKPEASVKNRNAGFLQHRKPLGYKPNAVTEYLMVYRKKTSKLIDWNIRQYDDGIVNRSRITGEYETSNLWFIDPKFDRVHSAVFPEALCERVIAYYSYTGDLIFDPFGGSGTVGRVARDLERYFFLTEQEEKYVERMRSSLGHTSLFDSQPTHFYDLDAFAKLQELT